jgi:hypothetical protein
MIEPGAYLVSAAGLASLLTDFFADFVDFFAPLAAFLVAGFSAAGAAAAAGLVSVLPPWALAIGALKTAALKAIAAMAKEVIVLVAFMLVPSLVF